MKLRAAASAVLALASACSSDLVPGESILGVDRPVDVVYGGEQSELGSSVAWNGSSWAAAAPGAGEVWVDGEATATGDAPPASAAFVGWMGESLVRAGPGGVVLEGEWLAGMGGTVFATSELGVFAWEAGELATSGGLVVAVAAVQALGADDEHVVALACDGACQPTGWLVGAQFYTMGGWEDLLIAGGSGGAIAFDQGAVCVGDPQLDDPDGAGSVTCDDGRFIQGEPGDHLGSAIGGGYAAGTFNKWVVPPRVRVAPLDGGEVFVLEEGAENQPIALAGDESTLIIGAPFHPHAGMPSGAVFTVSR